ncbi:MAG: FKBP-type peptidyl-prolyl cis-trans isomerase [Sediminibacterium sp.]
MKRLILFFVAPLCCINGFAQVKKNIAAKTQKTTAKSSIAANPFKNSRDSASYALGVVIAENLKRDGLGTVNILLLQKALADVLQNKKSAIEEMALNESIGKFQKKVATEKFAKFFADNGKRAGVVTLPAGLQYEVIKAGTDTSRPTLNDKVKCHYRGTLVDGTVFDSSIDRGAPVTFPLSNVIKGWQDALQLMTVGSKWKLYIPSDLAYGQNPPQGSPIKAGDALVFEVELLGVEK